MNKSIIIAILGVLLFLGFWFALTYKEERDANASVIVLTEEILMKIPPFEQKYIKQKDGNFHLVKNFIPFKHVFISSWGEESSIDFIDSLVSQMTQDNYSWLNLDFLENGIIIEETKITDEDNIEDVYVKSFEYDVIKGTAGYVLTDNSLQAVGENYGLDLIGHYMGFVKEKLRDYYEVKIKPITDTTKTFVSHDNIQSTSNNIPQIFFFISGDTLTLSKKSPTTIGVKFSAEVK